MNILINLKYTLAVTAGVCSSFAYAQKHPHIILIMTDQQRADAIGCMGNDAVISPNLYNPQIQISAESETKRSIFREKDKTKRSKKESAQHSKSRNKSFVMTSVSAL